MRKKTKGKLILAGIGALALGGTYKACFAGSGAEEKDVQYAKPVALEMEIKDGTDGKGEIIESKEPAGSAAYTLIVALGEELEKNPKAREAMTDSYKGLDENFLGAMKKFAGANKEALCNAYGPYLAPNAEIALADPCTFDARINILRSGIYFSHTYDGREYAATIQKDPFGLQHLVLHSMPSPREQIGIPVEGMAVIPAPYADKKDNAAKK